MVTIVDEIALGCRALIGTVFVASAASKLWGRKAFGSFVKSLERMRVVPAAVAVPLAALVVALELAAAGLLAVPLTLAGGLGFVLSGALLIGFTAAIASVVVRGIDTTCRCFGSSDVPLSKRHLARNAMLLAVTGLGLATELTGSPAGLPALLAAGVTGALLASLIIMFDEVYLLFTSSAQR